jgi:hypothetical protein
MKERVMTAVNKKERMMHLILLFSLLLFFVLMFILYGPGVYNDSDQYIKMHIHREPLYPLFLKLLRDFFGESFLYPMGIIQNVFMAIAIYLLTRTIGDQFKLPVSMEALVACIQVFPHIMTKYFSAMSVFVTNSVMSEALAFPCCRELKRRSLCSRENNIPHLLWMATPSPPALQTAKMRQRSIM